MQPSLQRRDQAGATGGFITVIGIRFAHVFCTGAVGPDRKAAFALGAESHVIGQRRSLSHDGAAGRCAGDLAAVIG